MSIEPLKNEEIVKHSHRAGITFRQTEKRLGGLSEPWKTGRGKQ